MKWVHMPEFGGAKKRGLDRGKCIWLSIAVVVVMVVSTSIAFASYSVGAGGLFDASPGTLHYSTSAVGPKLCLPCPPGEVGSPPGIPCKPRPPPCAPSISGVTVSVTSNGKSATFTWVDNPSNMTDAFWYQLYGGSNQPASPSHHQVTISGLIVPDVYNFTIKGTNWCNGIAWAYGQFWTSSAGGGTCPIGQLLVSNIISTSLLPTLQTFSWIVSPATNGITGVAPSQTFNYGTTNPPTQSASIGSQGGESDTVFSTTAGVTYYYEISAISPCYTSATSPLGVTEPLTVGVGDSEGYVSMNGIELANGWNFDANVGQSYALSSSIMSGYVFSQWVAAGGTLGSQTQSTTTFTPIFPLPNGMSTAVLYLDVKQTATDSWGGYIAGGLAGQAFSDVEGEFTVPNPQYVSGLWDWSSTETIGIWLGLGGTGSNLWQAGVIVSISPGVLGGYTTSITGVYEDILSQGTPAPYVTAPSSFAPSIGDTIYVAVSSASGVSNWSLDDLTNGDSWSGSISFTAGTNSAEWIVEAPQYTILYGAVNFRSVAPNFGSVTFSNPTVRGACSFDCPLTVESFLVPAEMSDAQYVFDCQVPGQNGCLDYYGIGFTAQELSASYKSFNVIWSSATWL